MPGRAERRVSLGTPVDLQRMVWLGRDRLCFASCYNLYMLQLPFGEPEHVWTCPNYIYALVSAGSCILAHCITKKVAYCYSPAERAALWSIPAYHVHYHSSCPPRVYATDMATLSTYDAASGELLGSVPCNELGAIYAATDTHVMFVPDVRVCLRSGARTVGPLGFWRGESEIVSEGGDYVVTTDDYMVLRIITSPRHVVLARLRKFPRLTHDQIHEVLRHVDSAAHGG